MLFYLVKRKKYFLLLGWKLQDDKLLKMDIKSADTMYSFQICEEPEHRLFSGQFCNF